MFYGILSTLYEKMLYHVYSIILIFDMKPYPALSHTRRHHAKYNSNNETI